MTSVQLLVSLALRRLSDDGLLEVIRQGDRAVLTFARSELYRRMFEAA